jgi:hypothetical protein
MQAARAETVNLLVVRGDGRRVLRMCLTPRGFLAAAGLILLASVSVGAALGAFYGAYSMLRHHRSNNASLLTRLAEQDALIDLCRKRVGEVRAEVDGWRDLHARLLKPFGPDGAFAVRGAGIGGGRASSPFDAPARPGTVEAELARLSDIVKDEGENLRSLEKLLGQASAMLAALPSRWPLRGPINSDFGPRLSPWARGSEFHSGLDIGAPVGTPVRAPAPGVVAFAGRHAEYGLSVVVDHGNGTKSLYGHLSHLDIGIDQPVARGQVIALSGNTGRSSGPHLHYEIRVNGQPVNPHRYIWE